MSNLKKTALAVIALGSTAAFAGTMGPVCSAVNVTVPCENTAWDLGGRALYIQPTIGAFQADRTISNASGTLTRGVDPQWGWGFQFEGSYHFSTGNDFNVNWYHFRGSNSRALAQPVTLTNVESNTIFPNGPLTNISTVTVQTADQSGNTGWDQVNMEFGQHVDFGENKFGRFHAGMQFARVQAGATTSSNGYTTANSAAYQFNTSNAANGVYNGFGPRVGTDLTYDWGNGLSVYGTGALGLLAGSSKTSYNIVDNVNARFANYSYSSARVVPTLDGKLGFMYTYAMAQGDLSFDIGWLWNEYIGAITTEGSTTAEHTNNFGLQGLYFGLKWVGNVA